MHDPAKVLLDLAVTLALGGDCLADIAVDWPSNPPGDPYAGGGRHFLHRPMLGLDPWTWWRREVYRASLKRAVATVLKTEPNR